MSVWFRGSVRDSHRVYKLLKCRITKMFNPRSTAGRDYKSTQCSWRNMTLCVFLRSHRVLSKIGLVVVEVDRKFSANDSDSMNTLSPFEINKTESSPC